MESLPAPASSAPCTPASRVPSERRSQTATSVRPHPSPSRGRCSLHRSLFTVHRSPVPCSLFTCSRSSRSSRPQAPSPAPLLALCLGLIATSNRSSGPGSNSAPRVSRGSAASCLARLRERQHRDHAVAVERRVSSSFDSRAVTGCETNTVGTRMKSPTREIEVISGCRVHVPRQLERRPLRGTGHRERPAARHSPRRGTTAASDTRSTMRDEERQQGGQQHEEQRRRGIMKRSSLCDTSHVRQEEEPRSTAAPRRSGS